MSVSYVASGVVPNAGAYALSLSFPKPASAQTGDIILVEITAYASTPDVPSGWQDLGIASGEYQARFMAREVAEGDTGWTFTAPGPNGIYVGLHYVIIRSGDSSAIVVGTPQYLASGDPRTIQGLATTRDNALLVLLKRDAAATSAPTGFTEDLDQRVLSAVADSGGGWAYVAHKAFTPAGATGTVSLDTAGVNARTYSLLIAIQPPPPPTVTTCVPEAGGVDGGTAVTLTGTGFTADSTVDIGGTAATSVVVVNSTTITCVTPARTAGAKTITVTNAGGSGTLASGFTYTSVQDAVVKLVKGGSVVGSNYGLTSTEWPGSLAYQSYGGQADLWGTTLTPANVNANDFGFVLSVDCTTGSVAKVDHALMRIYYTLPGLSDPGTFVAVLRVDSDRQTARPDLYKLPRSGFTVGNDPQIARAIDDAEFRLSRIYQPSRSVEKVWHGVDFWLDADPETNTPGVQIWARVDEGNEFQLLDANGSPATLRTTGPQKVFFPPSDVARGYYVQLLVKVPAATGDQVGGQYDIRNLTLHLSFRPERSETYDYVLILGDGEYEDRTSMRRTVSKQLSDLKRLVKRGLPAIPIRDPEGNDLYGHVVGLSWREVTFKGAPQKWATVATVKVRMARYE